MDKKVLLMILDGWGEGKHDRSNGMTAPTPSTLRELPISTSSGHNTPYRF